LIFLTKRNYCGEEFQIHHALLLKGLDAQPGAPVFDKGLSVVVCGNRTKHHNCAGVISARSLLFIPLSLP
jgi:hypothetical protein